MIYMFKTFKFRIYPDERQTVLIDKTIDCARFIYNKMLEDKIACYENNKTMLYVTPAQYKLKYDFLNEIDSLALTNAQINLDLAYDYFFKNPKYGYPKFKSRKKAQKAYTTNLVNNNIRLENGQIRLPKIGFVKIKKHRQIPDSYQLKSCTVCKTSTGKYFVAILYHYETTISEQPIATILGLKLIDNGWETSDANMLIYPINIKRTLTAYIRQAKKISKMQYRSNNYKKQRRKIARIREKLINQCNDYLHKITRQITNAYDCVAIEDINCGDKTSNNAIIPNLDGNFVRVLTYKLAELGKHLLIINPNDLPFQYSAMDIKNTASTMVIT